jgi:hypothetical protein
MIYDKCERCLAQPGQLVRFFHDQHEEALCFTCWKPLTWTGAVGVGECKVLHWIDKHGKLQA